MPTDLALSLSLYPERMAVCKLPPDAPVPIWAASATSPLVSVTRTRDELSLVVPEASVPAFGNGLHSEAGWRVFMVVGPLAFGLVGILAHLTTALAQANVPVFALSTFDTDYLLVKDADVGAAIDALRRASCAVSGTPQEEAQVANRRTA